MVRQSKKEKKREEMLLNMKRFRHNWRTDMLAVPKGHEEERAIYALPPEQQDRALSQLRARKDREQSEEGPKGDPNKLHGAFEYVKEISLPTLRYVTNLKKEHKHLSHHLTTNLDTYIKLNRRSRYYAYKHARQEYLRRKESEKKRSKTGKSRSTSRRSRKPRKEKLKELYEHMVELSKPKKRIPPPKVNRGKRLKSATRIYELCKPTHVYKKSSITSWKLTDKAKNYKITERLLTISQPRHYEIEEPKDPTVVTKEALQYKATPAILELAKPKPRAATKEADYNENAFKISPQALKYVATPRIIELAKPADRD